MFKKPNYLLLLFILIIPAFIALLKPGYWNMHDDMQLIRQLELEKCIHDGQIPCRWTPDLGYGYGFPLFNFYPPMPYIVGQVFRTFGFTFIWSIKLTAITQIIVFALAVFLLAKNLFGPKCGFLAAIIATYAPYHALNIYVRGAMNEVWAAVFFPLCLYFSKKLIEKFKYEYFFLFSLSLVGLLFSHNPMTLIFFPFLGLWCLYHLFQNKFIKNIKKYLHLIYSGIFGLSLAAFFTLPALIETKYVQIKTMFDGYYTFNIHFTSLRQLFISSFWGDGASVWGQEDQMSFMIGYLHWIIPTIAIFYFAYKIYKNKKYNSQYNYPILFTAFGFITAFLTHERSAFIWVLLSPLQKIQFPWRFLNLTTFFFSLASASFIFTLIQEKKIKQYKDYIVYAIVVITILLNLNYFKPLHSGPITDAQKFSGQAWVNQVTSGIYDYLPNNASRAPTSPARFPVDNVTPEKQDYQITGLKQGTDWFFFNIELPQDSVVTLSQFAFPNFEIYNNNQKISYLTEPEIGRMQISLPSGHNQLYIKLRNTPIRFFTNFISIISWLSLFTYYLYWLWKKLISKK